MMKGIQIHRTGSYTYTLLAENQEGTDSKSFDVTVIGMVPGLLFNFVSITIKRLAFNKYTTVDSR